MSDIEIQTAPTLAIFAAAALPGDPDYTRIVSLAGTLFARNGVKLVLPVEGGAYCRPLVTAARGAGGEVTLISDGSLTPDAFAEGCEVEVIEEEEARFQHLSELADGFVGFPAGIRAVRAMFNVWVLAGGGASGKPVALLNRNRAYEVLRGFGVDVLSHSLAQADRMLIIAETTEDLWAQLRPRLA